MHLLACLSVLGGALEVWREGGRISVPQQQALAAVAPRDAASSAADIAHQPATLFTLTRVSNLPYRVRFIKDKALPAEVNRSIADGMYLMGGAVADTGDSLLILLNQQHAAGAQGTLTFAQMQAQAAPSIMQCNDGGATSSESPLTLQGLHDLLHPLLVNPEPTRPVTHAADAVDESRLGEDDFVLTVLRRYALRVLLRACEQAVPQMQASALEFSSTCSSHVLSSSVSPSLLRALSLWSLRPCAHFADAASSIANLEARIRSMLVMERESSDDRRFKVRDNKTIRAATTTTDRRNSVNELTSARQADDATSVLVPSSLFRCVCGYPSALALVVFSVSPLWHLLRRWSRPWTRSISAC